MPRTLLTTIEVAEALGVKPATVYSYVSRGLLSPVKQPGRRQSRFSPDEVESLKTGRHRATTHGLVIESAITLIENGRYWYRGHDAIDLAASLPFESVADVLWTGRPMPARWSRDEETILATGAGLAALPPTASILQRIQAMVLTLSVTDTLSTSVGPSALATTGRAMLTTVVHSLADATGFGTMAADGRRATRPTIASALAMALGNRGAEPAIDQALGLLADHGLAPSTTAVRVAAGFGAGIHQATLAGLATLSGQLHGGACSAAQTMLTDAAGTTVELAVERAMRNGTVPGVGQTLYPDGDPRYRAIVETLRRRMENSSTINALDDIEDLCNKRGWGHTNIDMGLGALCAAYELHPGSGEAIFAIGRMAGWIAHASEALTADRIRPRARYTGTQPGAGERVSEL